MNGLLIVNKPVSMRSTDCVQRVRRIAGKSVKVGHGGTLDSTASGVLVLLLGRATRMSDTVMRMGKKYVVTASLGARTSTDDYSGEVVSRYEGSLPAPADFDSAIPAFLGWRMQEPPQISAVSVDGRRAHVISRCGGRAEVKPRPVYISSVKRISDVRNGEVKFIIECGKGTFVRSFIRDMGIMLGCGAHVKELVRTSVGPFSLHDAPNVLDVMEMSGRDVEKILIREKDVAWDVPCYSNRASEERMLLFGLDIPAFRSRRAGFGLKDSLSEVMVLSESLLSLCKTENVNGRLYFAPKSNVVLSGGQE